MKFVFEQRPSDSPFVDMVWRTQSESAGSFMSAAGIQWEMVVMKQYGKTFLTVRGPETKASPAPCPENTEFFGIRFKLGTFMPKFPTSNLVDDAVHLPVEMRKAVWVDGSTWEVPDFENADTFVERLVRDEMLVHEPIIDAALQGQLQGISVRSVQRRFVRATGLTHGAICQIERAQQAVALLGQGVSILDTVEQAGYADQPHLTRSLKRLVGQTPAQILRRELPV
ncbi:MAG: helix-turn-helix transcriptional regulator [Caldilineaceae bacterium]|nr:helix-turn-helix transcriptional regulator [Caldilineaceae bacterium]